MTQEQYAAMTAEQQAAYWKQWQYWQQYQQQQWAAPDYAAQQYAQYPVRACFCSLLTCGLVGTPAGGPT